MNGIRLRYRKMILFNKASTRNSFRVWVLQSNFVLELLKFSRKFSTVLKRVKWERDYIKEDRKVWRERRRKLLKIRRFWRKEPIILKLRPRDKRASQCSKIKQANLKFLKEIKPQSKRKANIFLIKRDKKVLRKRK